MARLSWFVPRNLRRIPPLKVSLIMRAFFIASDLGKAWTGRQDQQDYFSALLDQYGLKKGGSLRDLNSGGARTYIAQLKLLGLIYKNQNGDYVPTLSGLDILDSCEIVKTLQYQLLKVQYPSTYTQSRSSAIDNKFQIRPFVFLLNLAADPDINGLSDEDICVPIFFGENRQSFQICKELIIKSRTDGLQSVIPNTIELKQTSKKTLTHLELIAMLKADVANTFSNYLDSTGLGIRKYVETENRIFPNPEIKELFEEVDSTPLIRFEGQGVNQADRQFGNRRGAVKDTRRNLELNRIPVLDSQKGFIYKRFLSEVGLPTTVNKINEFAKKLAIEFKVSTSEVLEALDPIILNQNFCASERLLEVSRGGAKTAEAFEKIVANIFEYDFGYSATWTGRKHRKETGGFMDVFVVEIKRDLCGIIDTKSMEKYSLPSQDYSKAVSYYSEGVKELYGHRDLKLKFIAYISHLIKPEAQIRAQEIYEKKGIPVSLISAYGLNSMRNDKTFIGNPDLVTDTLSAKSVVFID